MAGPTVRRIWTLALAVLAAARHASPSPGARALDAHTIEHGGRLYVAVDTLSDEAPRRRLASDDEHLPPFSSEWFAFIAMAVTCVVCAAFAAGLTMGLVALDPMQLQITLHMDVRDCASAHEREALLRDQACALRVLPLIENHHLLLVTLLLVNAGANEALPIFLDALLPSWAAILVSVTGVLIFGEIIPSAIFTGPNQLRIASTLSPLVYALIALASPIAYPLALALDHLLGDGHAPGAFRRQELRAIMKMVADEERADGQQARVSRPSVLVSQTADGQQEVSAALSDDELCIINGVLDIRNKRASDALIPLSATYMLPIDTALGSEAMARIVAKGHSRIPVYRGSPHNVCGILLVKKLIVLSPDDERKISSLGLRYPLPVSPDTPLLELLNLFQRGLSHLALVTDQPELVAECMRTGADIPPDVHMDGIVTLEDILENIIAEGISDETDEGVAHRLTSAAKTRARVHKVKQLADSMRGAQPAAATAGGRSAEPRPGLPTTATAISEAMLRRTREHAAAAAGEERGVGTRAALGPSPQAKLRNRAALLHSLSRQGSVNALLAQPQQPGLPALPAQPVSPRRRVDSTLEAIGGSLRGHPQPYGYSRSQSGDVRALGQGDGGGGGAGEEAAGAGTPPRHAALSLPNTPLLKQPLLEPRLQGGRRSEDDLSGAGGGA